MSLIEKILCFLICYVPLMILLLFVSRKIISVMRPSEEKNNFPITVFAILSCIMAVICIVVCISTLGGRINELWKDFSFFALTIIIVIQFILSICVLVFRSNEVLYVFKYGAHQMFSGIVLVIILSYVLSEIIFGTMF